jgi:GST-like protein
MLELFGADTGNSYRAAIALYEADVPFVAKVVDLRGGEHRTQHS